ncbi:hypothetical protein [Dysgonomonas termitidis]|uniref:Group II intron maturase-specific domain-containing protein n=1 Tax=Dysgonomonas termitidis TaxID=1516126 RepID=A0ABV9L1Q6_9BACT
MYNELKWLVRKCYRKRQVTPDKNFLKLIIRMQEKKIMLVFFIKPPPEHRKQIRTYNFRWSRKYRYWHAYLNNNRLEQVRKLYKMIDKNNL